MSLPKRRRMDSPINVRVDYVGHALASYRNYFECHPHHKVSQLRDAIADALQCEPRRLKLVMYDSDDDDDGDVISMDVFVGSIADLPTILVQCHIDPMVTFESRGEAAWTHNAVSDSDISKDSKGRGTPLMTYPTMVTETSRLLRGIKTSVLDSCVPIVLQALILEYCVCHFIEPEYLICDNTNDTRYQLAAPEASTHGPAFTRLTHKVIHAHMSMAVMARMTVKGVGRTQWVLIAEWRSQGPICLGQASQSSSLPESMVILSPPRLTEEPKQQVSETFYRYVVHNALNVPQTMVAAWFPMRMRCNTIDEHTTELLVPRVDPFFY